MNEIRFRHSEEQLIEEQLKRRKAYKYIGAEHIRCDKCGGHIYVMPLLAGRTFECERCWAERRYYEIVDGVSDDT